MIGGSVSPASLRRRRFLPVLAALAALLVGGSLYWHLSRASAAVQTKKAGQGAAVPVSVATVAKHDLPIYLSGLGIVQASFTVAIQSQVDGKLIDVRFTEGQRVKKGDVLAKIDPSLYQAALDQAVARKAQDEAQLTAADKDLERAKDLVAKQVGTAQVLDQRQGAVDQLKAKIAADEAEISTARTQLTRTDIVAPSDGRVGIRQIDPGNIVRTSDKQTIVTLTETRPAAVIFTLPAKNLDDVRDALARGEVAVTALDQDNRRTLATGKLLLIDNLIDQATATIRLKATFDNTDDQLWPGEFVNARILLETERGALAVPPNVVQRGPKGLFAWVVTPQGTAEMRSIAVGPTTDHFTIVTAGLAEGDRVVVDGQLKLRVGAVVNASVPVTNVAGNAP
jgi:multidrug efflux system membrane fusion protein